jgi:hypothetical protein
MTRAKYEANAAGYDPSPTQLVIAAEKAYDEIFAKPQEKPPFTERSASGSGATEVEAGGPPQKSELERIYKVKAGFIRPPYDVGDQAEMNSINNEYVSQRMKPMMERGLNSDYANLISASLDLEEKA